jgi:shikimate kinase
VSSTAPHVALVGLSGSGKSTLAPLLAARLGGRVTVDLDRIVERRFGRTVADVFDTEGEATFRVAESEALAEALGGPPAVIATGGGVVLSAENRALLRSSATVVWLRAHPSALQQRLEGTAEARPLLAGDAGFALARLSEERSALYSQVADLTVDADGVAPADLAAEVADALH